MASLQPRFTREAYERLQQELQELKAKRGEIREDIREAREQGDLRENFAYHAARNEQSMLEARIANIELRLGDAIIVEVGESVDEVVLGVPVMVRREGADEPRRYVIVSSEELEDVEDGASEESPIGSALMGKKVGEIAEVEGPNGIVKFEILSIG